MIIQTSIRLKLLRWIIIVLSVILFVYSVIILKRQKENILKRHISVASALSQTAVIPIIDAFLYKSPDSPVSDNYLQDYVNQLWENKTSQIKFIVILDDQGQVRAHSKVAEYGNNYSDMYSRCAIQADSLQSHIYNSQEFGWVLEIAVPIGILSKIWGAVRIGFEGETLRNELNETLINILVMFIIVILSIVFSVYLITSGITKKLVDTAAIMDKIDLQNDSLVSFPSSDDEIGLLNNKFIQLQKRLIAFRKKLQQTNQNLYQTEKLAAIGRLASGVAHEINNPLLGLRNCLYLIETYPDDKKNRDQNLNLLNDGIKKIEDIVQKLLNNARKASVNISDFQINESIKNVLDLLDYRFSSRTIELKTELNSDLPFYHGNRSILEEALLNIILNAIDAIVDSGVIFIRSKIENDVIMIIVQDSGSGINDEIKNQIFDPFFTTKEIGKGTGLGLYVTRDIIEGMGGEIQIETVDDAVGGTRFSLLIPISDNKDRVVS